MNRDEKLRHAPHLQAQYLRAIREHELEQRLDVACAVLGLLLYFSIFIVPLAVLYLREMLPWQ